MDKEIANIKIEKFFNDECYMGVYSIDSITWYVNFYEIIIKNAKYPFAIFNTDKHNEPRTHWGSFMDIHTLPHPPPKKTLFENLGLDGFKMFVVDKNERIIDKILFNFKKNVK